MQTTNSRFTIAVLASMILALSGAPVAAAATQPAGGTSADPELTVRAAGTAGKPVLLSPANGANVSDTTPTLTWQAPVNAVKYQVQVATNYTFGSSIVYDAMDVVGETATPIDPLADHRYYWHVRAYDGGGLPGAWSAYWSFKVDTIAPPAPTLYKPGEGATKRGTPTFSWNAAAGAKYYVFEYDDDSLFGSANFTSTPLATLYYKPPATGAGTFYWHVKALDKAGNESGWSAARSIDIMDPIPARPTLIAPASGYETENTSPTFQWSDVAYAATYEVQFADTSTFDVPLPSYTGPWTTSLAIGINQGKWFWHVRAINQHSEPGPWSATRSFTIYPTLNSQFNGDRTGWSDVLGTWSVNSTELSTPGLGSTQTASIGHGGDGFQDFTFMARMKMDFNASQPWETLNEYGLILRGEATLGSGGDWKDGFYFVLAQTHDVVHSWGATTCYTVFKMQNWVRTSLTGGYYWCNPAGTANWPNFADWNELKVTARGTTFRFYVNDVLLFSKSATGSPGASWPGIMTHRPDYAEITHVDWVTLGAPPASTSFSQAQALGGKPFTLDAQGFLQPVDETATPEK